MPRVICISQAPLHHPTALRVVINVRASAFAPLFARSPVFMQERPQECGHGTQERAPHLLGAAANVNIATKFASSCPSSVRNLCLPEYRGNASGFEDMVRLWCVFVLFASLPGWAARYALILSD